MLVPSTTNPSRRSKQYMMHPEHLRRSPRDQQRCIERTGGGRCASIFEVCIEGRQRMPQFERPFVERGRAVGGSRWLAQPASSRFEPVRQQYARSGPHASRHTRPRHSQPSRPSPPGTGPPPRAPPPPPTPTPPRRTGRRRTREAGLRPGRPARARPP